MPLTQRNLRTRTRTMLCVLAFALWAATTLGLLHGTLHGAEASAHADAATGAVAGKAAASRGLSALFGVHTEAECRLYDQLSHGAAAPVVPPVFLPVLLPAASFVWLEGEVFARWIALFDARGPPSTR